MSANWTNYSVGTHPGDDEGPHVVSEDVPACASCRKRKLKCSRETPTCAHCVRLAVECVYSPKQKPGLKPGALEALARRVAFLEGILLDESGSVRSQFDVDDATAEPRQNGAPTVQSDDGSGMRPTSELQADGTVDEKHPTPQKECLGSNNTNGHETQQRFADEQPMNPRKRKSEPALLTSSFFAIDDIDISEYLPSQPLLLKIVDYFCLSFHHWIPYLHKQRLKDQVSRGLQNAGLDLVLHALTAVALRHMDRNVTFLDLDQVREQTKISRFIVENLALKNTSLESLRALIFIVFDHLNNGQHQKAWPLIGSLTRTVDYMQVTLEPSASQFGALMNPLRLVHSTSDWTELEERRRLFWVIFLLDRFCSVSTGWNTSLTAEDVHRRLPADGGYFTREEPVTTPYFGLWNKAAARIGRSLAHVPAQYNEEDPAVEQVQGASPGSANGIIDSSKLGAFAYCIEATESLSQVTTFFLQQRINWHDKEHAVSWLTRFKELDLRLVQWKMFLPPRWKDSNISADTQVVDMDPNLTLAHMTHNTSMILLHHSIAYPSKGWNNYVALPKECSAQTCEHAAVETSNIVDRFLMHTPIPFVNVQFAFCAFVAAKALLFEHQSTKTPIRPEFHRLVRNLWNMSHRWTGIDASHAPEDQAGFYAQHLGELWDSCREDSRFRFDLYDHSCQKASTIYASPASTSTPSQYFSGSIRDRSQLTGKHRQSSLNSNISPISPRRLPSSNAMDIASIASPVDQRHPRHNLPQPVTTPSQPSPTLHLPGSHQNTLPPGPPNPQFHPLNAPPNTQQTLQDQSLLNLSDTFMDSHFLDMDRVITFEDANFFLPGDAFRWQ